MAASDALPIPRKNVAMRVTFGIFDADGDPVSGATGLDSEVSKDGGSFTDATSEATEIGSTGIYYLDLTSTEMNADTVAVQVKTSSSGAKTTVIVMYPEESGDMRIDNATLVSAIWAAVVDSSGVTTLLSRLSSARAGYLDNLSAGAVALASSLTSAAADITTILSRVTAAVATAAGLSTAQADLTTLVSRITGAVSLATATTAAAIRAALGLGSANLDTQLGDLPTAAENADAIWDELLSGHATAGTAGHYLTDAGAAADPMMNDPADYTSGQLGYLIGRLAGGRITVRGTVTPSGDMDEIVGGADYSASDGYSFDWTDADSELAWPALTSATVTWVGRSPDGQETTLSMTVVTPTGDKVVRLALTAAQTAALVAVQTGLWTFTVWATLTSGRVRPLAKGTVPVIELVGP